MTNPCTGLTGEALKQCLCANGTCTDVIYFFHPDHLGSSTFLTDFNGQGYEFMLYLPFGEALAQQKAAGYSTPYKFTSKERDEHTGLDYYGARYYDPSLGIWYGVDPLSEDYPEFSPFNYCLNNPIIILDPDGRGPGKKIWGALRVAGGAVQVVVGAVGGAATSWTGVGAVAGVIAVTHGADDIQAGIRQIWTGEETESFTHKGLKAGAKAAGASDATASNLAMGGDIALGFVGGAGSLKVIQFANKFKLGNLGVNTIKGVSTLIGNIGKNGNRLVSEIIAIDKQKGYTGKVFQNLLDHLAKVGKAQGTKGLDIVFREISDPSTVKMYMEQAKIYGAKLTYSLNEKSSKTKQIVDIIWSF